MDCASRWEAIHIDGIHYPSGVPAHMGTSVHHGTACFDQAKVEGREPSLDEAVHETMNKFQHPEGDVVWTADDYSKSDALLVSILATEAYCNKISPRYEFKAVELRPKPILINVEGVDIEISGQMDRTRIKKDSKGVGINDVKTGKQAVSSTGVVKTNGFKFQMGVYEILTEHSMGIPITLPAEISAVTTTKNVRTGIGIVHGAKELMLGTEEEPGIIEKAGVMVKHGVFPPNPRSMLCSEKYCPKWAKCKAHD